MYICIYVYIYIYICIVWIYIYIYTHPNYKSSYPCIFQDRSKFDWQCRQRQLNFMATHLLARFRSACQNYVLVGVDLVPSSLTGFSHLHIYIYAGYYPCYALVFPMVEPRHQTSPHHVKSGFNKLCVQKSLLKKWCNSCKPNGLPYFGCHYKNPKNIEYIFYSS